MKKKKLIKKIIFISSFIMLSVMMTNMIYAQDTNIFPGTGNVGIGTASPLYFLHVEKNSTSGTPTQLPFIQVSNTNPATTGYNFAGFGFAAQNDGVKLDMFVDGTGFFNPNTPKDPCVYFRVKQAYPMFFGTSNTIRMMITGDGKVGIGTTVPTTELEISGTVTATNFATTGNMVIGTGLTTPAGYNLYVEEGILAEKVKVAVKGSADWADFVFEDGYELQDLAEVERHIKTNKTLPGIPSADKVVNDGLDLGKMDALLLQKIEELTLYIIQQQKEIETLKGQLNASATK